jgi:magnesium transporter
MDDDGDMAEMYLTEKKMRMESSVFSDQPLLAAFNSGGAGTSVSAPVSPVSSPTESRKLEKTFSLCRSRHDSVKSSDNTVTEHIEELEMLLEAYFVVIDSTLNKLTSVMIYLSSISSISLSSISSISFYVSMIGSHISEWVFPSCS